MPGQDGSINKNRLTGRGSPVCALLTPWAGEFMHLGWAGREQALGRTAGRNGIGDPFFPFCGSRKGGGRGLRGEQVGCGRGRAWGNSGGGRAELPSRRLPFGRSDRHGRSGRSQRVRERDSGTCDKMGWGRDVRGRDGTARLRERDWDLHINFEMTGSASGRPTREAKRSQRRASPSAQGPLSFPLPLPTFLSDSHATGPLALTGPSGRPDVQTITV